MPKIENNSRETPALPETSIENGLTTNAVTYFLIPSAGNSSKSSSSSNSPRSDFLLWLIFSAFSFDVIV